MKNWSKLLSKWPIQYPRRNIQSVWEKKIIHCKSLKRVTGAQPTEYCYHVEYFSSFVYLEWTKWNECFHSLYCFSLNTFIISRNTLKYHTCVFCYSTRLLYVWFIVDVFCFLFIILSYDSCVPVIWDCFSSKDIVMSLQIIYISQLSVYFVFVIDIDSMRFLFIFGSSRFLKTKSYLKLGFL